MSTMEQRNQVLFVCTGNICRSPMAEYMLRDRLGPGAAFKSLSAGVMGCSAMPASRAAVEALDELGIDLRDHRSQAITRELVEQSAVIVAMTGSHVAQLWAMFRDIDFDDRLFLMRSFEEGHDGEDVEDPIGFPVEVYREVREQIAAALPGLVAYINELT